MLAQAESVIVMGTAATYSEELASCFEDANQEQALHQLRSACRKTLTTVKPMTSSEARISGQLLIDFQQLSETHSDQYLIKTSFRIRSLTHSSLKMGLRIAQNLPVVLIRL